MRFFIVIGCMVLFLFSCRENRKTITNPEHNVALHKDSTAIEIADLPILIDSTQYLIHPIGSYKIEDEFGKTIFKSSRYGRNQNFTISNYSRYRLSGNISNIKFQKLDSDIMIPLTDDYIKIDEVNFLGGIYESLKKQYLLYKVKDKDTNGDGKLDYNDLDALYISKIDGSGFIKLTKSYQKLIGWKVINTLNRIYFRTIEDKNRDGSFNENDLVKYQYVDLSLDNLEVEEYNPFK